jgi:hypothetical protein
MNTKRVYTILIIQILEEFNKETRFVRGKRRNNAALKIKT